MKQYRKWIVPLVWMGVIFYLSSRTSSQLDTLLPFFHLFIPSMESFDWGHFFAYFILACCYYWPFANRTPGWKGKVAIVICSGLYGLTDEFHQSFVPGRTPDLMDIRNDMIGAALAMLFVSIPRIRDLLQKWQNSK
ncbi:MAG: VanZ family protein [Paenibacillaceae bacterium]|jgi:VanZ family protein|nr:VanZ family protein [Paenibacillaceae bacterium]